MTDAFGSLAAALEAEHRRLDDLFGRLLAATEMRDLAAARSAIEEFDEALRSHTAMEEERLYSEAPAAKLVPGVDETKKRRRVREMLLEHVQIREVSGMMRQLLAEKGDLAAARGLAGNLARRWDAHTTREEREVFPEIEADGE